jgi:GTPase involved in cell partitioning and DNA repair
MRPLDSAAHLDTLAEFAFKVHFFAKPGERGARKKQHGHAGDDLRVRLPLGCLVYDAETDELLVDMVEPGQESDGVIVRVQLSRSTSRSSPSVLYVGFWPSAATTRRA